MTILYHRYISMQTLMSLNVPKEAWATYEGRADIENIPSTHTKYWWLLAYSCLKEWYLNNSVSKKNHIFSSTFTTSINIKNGTIAFCWHSALASRRAMASNSRTKGMSRKFFILRWVATNQNESALERSGHIKDIFLITLQMIERRNSFFTRSVSIWMPMICQDKLRIRVNDDFWCICNCFQDIK